MKFYARVQDAGGGIVMLLVDRDTEEYPRIGERVLVTADLLPTEDHWKHFGSLVEQLRTYQSQPHGTGERPSENEQEQG